MTDITVEIMAEVLAIIGMATKEVKRGRMSEFYLSVGLRLLTRIVFRKVPEEVDRKHGHRGQSTSTGQADTRRGSDGVCGATEDRSQCRGESDGCRRQVTGRRSQIGRYYSFVVSYRSCSHSECSDLSTGNLLRDDLLRWLSPSDPSINHNIASKVHHDGTAQWFFQGRIFNQWKSGKSAGSLLWLQGKRVFLFILTLQHQS